MNNIELSINSSYKFNIQKILICMYSIGIFTPFILNKYLSFVCSIGLLFFINTIKTWMKSLFKDKLLLWCTILFCLEVIYRILGVSSAAIGNYALRFLTYTSVWIGIYTYTCMPLKYHYFIVKFSILVILLNLLDNIRIYTLYPELRATGRLEDIAYLVSHNITNLGLTSFSYIILFLTIFCFLKCLLKSNYRFLWFILFIFLCVYILAYTGSGTIILSLILSICFILFSKIKQMNIVKLFVVFILIFIFIKIFNNFLYSIINMIEPFVGNKVVTRFKIILALFSNEKSYLISNNYLARVNFLIYDIKIWLFNIKNFLIGKGYHTTSELSVYQSVMITGDGGHSGFIDLIPRYGIFGFLSCLQIMKYGFFIKNFCKTHYFYKNFIIMYLIFIFNNIFNNIFNSGIIFILFVFYSLIFFRKETIKWKINTKF